MDILFGDKQELINSTEVNMFNPFEDMIDKTSSYRLIKNFGVTSTTLGIDNKITKNEKNKLIHDLIRKTFTKLEEDNINNNETALPQTLDTEIIYVIDRFEGNFAVCENRETGEMLNVELSKLPNGLEEGDILIYKDNVFIKDVNKRKEIEDRINEKVKNIFED